MVYLTTLKMISNIAFYDKFKRRLMPAGDNKYSGVSNAWRRIVAALASGSVTIMFSYPFEVFFTRITADMTGKTSRRLYSNTFDCFNLTQMEGGFRRIYVGSSVALFNILPATLWMLPIYDSMNNSTPQGSKNSAQDIIAKYIGPKFTAAFATMMIWYPLDTLKRCMMVVGSRGYSAVDHGLINTFKSIYKAHGIRGYYRGVHLAVLKIFPSVYLQLFIYDYLKNYSIINEKEPSLDLACASLSLVESQENKEPQKA